MGVYIPNMKIPKSCEECQWYYENYDESCTLGNFLLRKYPTDVSEEPYILDIQRHPNCPLIEIDLVRCGECKHYGFKETDRGGFPCCTNVIGATPYRMPTDFCSYGERRADEHNT